MKDGIYKLQVQVPRNTYAMILGKVVGNVIVELAPSQANKYYKDIIGRNITIPDSKYIISVEETNIKSWE